MLFAAEGARIFVTSKTEAHCAELVDRLRATGAEAAYAAADLSDEAQANAAVDACRATFGRIDGLLAVAGGSGRRFGDGPVHTLTGDGVGRDAGAQRAQPGAGPAPRSCE